MHDSAYDFLTPATAMVFCDQPVVGLSPWLTRAYAGAVESGRRFVVLTPSTSSITLPLSALLDGQASAWMATGADGGFFDAVTGRAQTWDGDGLRPGDAVADDFLSAERLQSAYLHVRAGVFHPASHTTRAGAFTARVFEAVTDSAPVGWGLYEPVSETWDEAAFSGFCHRRSPGSTRLVVVGSVPGTPGSPGLAAGSVAVVTVERTRTGVLESVELLAEAEAPLDDAALDAFLAAMHTARARSAVLAYGLGYNSLARPARFTGTAVPGCALFGPESLAGRSTQGGASGRAPEAAQAGTSAQAALGGTSAQAGASAQAGTSGRAPEAAQAGTSAQAALALAGPRARLLGTAPAQSLSVRYAPEPVPGEPHPLEAYARLTLELGGSSEGTSV